jgi:putative phosphonate metabolism protein
MMTIEELRSAPFATTAERLGLGSAVKTRYALYFAPRRNSRWWAFGATFLGRDEHNGRKLRQPTVSQLSPERLAELTKASARYGFHATLKAPFALAPGRVEYTLLQRIDALRTTLRSLPLGDMRIAPLGNFLALVPANEPPGLRALADACVADLDDLRAPMDEADRQRRLDSHLDQRQRDLLDRYGYPHVLEHFRFHMSLTGPIEPAEARWITAAMADQVAELNVQEPLSLDRLCLFIESAPGEPFHRVLDLRLRA